MRAPFEYVSHGDVCMGCVDVIAPGDTAAPVDSDRPDRLLCVACWWLQECGLTLPRWTRAGGGRTRLDGVFRSARRDER